MKRRRPFSIVLVVSLALSAALWGSGDDSPAMAQEPVRVPILKTFKTGRVGSFAFDSKGQMLVTVGWESGEKDGMKMWTDGTTRGDIRVWNVGTGLEVAHFGTDVGGLFGVAFSPDDKTVVTAGRTLNSPRKGLVRVWDLKTHQPIRTFEGPTNWVLSATWSPDGKRIAAGGFERTSRVWEAATGKLVTTFTYGKMGPRSLCFSRDGRDLVAGYGKGSVVIWETQTWTEREIFDAKKLYLMSAELSLDSKLLLAGGMDVDVKPGTNQGGQVRIWDVASGQEREPIRINTFVSSVAFSPDGKHFAAASLVSKIWQTKTADETADLVHTSSTSGDRIGFSPDGKILAISGLSDVTLWDVSRLNGH